MITRSSGFDSACRRLDREERCTDISADIQDTMGQVVDMEIEVAPARVYYTTITMFRKDERGELHG